MRGGDNPDRPVRAEFLYEFIDQLRINQWFIPLNVDDEPELFRVTYDFGRSVSAAAMACRSQRNFGTPIKSSLGDAHVVCGNDHRVEVFSSFAALPYTLQKRFSSNEMQWFSWKTRR